MPAPAQRRASAALSPDPAPTISARSPVVIAALPHIDPRNRIAPYRADRAADASAKQPVRPRGGRGDADAAAGAAMPATKSLVGAKPPPTIGVQYRTLADNLPNSSNHKNSSI
jgi:hypothetical protein